MTVLFAGVSADVAGRSFAHKLARNFVPLVEVQDVVVVVCDSGGVHGDHVQQNRGVEVTKFAGRLSGVDVCNGQFDGRSGGIRSDVELDNVVSIETGHVQNAANHGQSEGSVEDVALGNHIEIVVRTGQVDSLDGVVAGVGNVDVMDASRSGGTGIASDASRRIELAGRFDSVACTDDRRIGSSSVVRGSVRRSASRSSSLGCPSTSGSSSADGSDQRAFACARSSEGILAIVVEITRESRSSNDFHVFGGVVGHWDPFPASDSVDAMKVGEDAVTAVSGAVDAHGVEQLVVFQDGSDFATRYDYSSKSAGGVVGDDQLVFIVSASDVCEIRAEWAVVTGDELIAVARCGAAVSGWSLDPRQGVAAEIDGRLCWSC